MLSRAGTAPHARWNAILRDGIPLAVLAGWFIASQGTPEFVLPDPATVFLRTLELFVDPRLALHTAASFVRVVVSLVVALALGIGLTVLGRNVRVLRGFVTDRLLPFLNAFPTLGWAILAIYWFGVRDFTIVFVEVAIVLPFIMTNAWQGLTQLDSGLLELGRSLTRHRLRVFRKIVFPMLLPYLYAALRVSYGVCWKIALIAEIFGTQRGLGYLLNYARSQFDTALMFATVAAIIVLVFVVDRFVLRTIERRIVPRTS